MGVGDHRDLTAFAEATRHRLVSRSVATWRRTITKLLEAEIHWLDLDQIDACHYEPEISHRLRRWLPNRARLWQHPRPVTVTGRNPGNLVRLPGHLLAAAVKVSRTGSHQPNAGRNHRMEARPAALKSVRRRSVRALSEPTQKCL
jgi:hypothetical protein